MSRRITNILKILFIFAVHLSLGGGIGRRARLKLVFFGVWVRFPPKVLTLQKSLRGFLLSKKKEISQVIFRKLSCFFEMGANEKF